MFHSCNRPFKRCANQQQAHMSEEVKHATKAIPKAMITVYLLNFALLFPALVTICCHMPGLTEALNDSTTYPAVYVLRVSMGTAWVTVILTTITLICIARCINYFAAVTRDVFAFARKRTLISLCLSCLKSTADSATHSLWATTACISLPGSARCTGHATFPVTPVLFQPFSPPCFL